MFVVGHRCSGNHAARHFRRARAQRDNGQNDKEDDLSAQMMTGVSVENGAKIAVWPRSQLPTLQYRTLGADIGHNVESDFTFSYVLWRKAGDS
jgi:hypothetical protein